MAELFKTAYNMYVSYAGTSFIMILFALSLVYLIIAEKKKNIRDLLIYLPIAILVLFFFPPLIYIVTKFIINDDGESYYRTLWAVPVYTVIAYAITKFITSTRKSAVKVAAAIIGVVCIILSGRYVYKNPYFTKTENRYQLPNAVINVCNAIVVDGREVRAVFPAELVQYVRQYTPFVLMPYGRESLVDRWNMQHPMYQTMQAPVVDVSKLAKQAKEYQCAYIILNENREVSGDLRDCGFKLTDNINGFNIYVDPDVYLGL